MENKIVDFNKIKESWKDLLTLIKQKLEDKERITPEMIDAIKDKTIDQGVEILKTYSNRYPLRLDDELLAKLKDAVYYTYCKQDETGKYLQTKEAFLSNPSDNEIHSKFVSNQIYSVSSKVPLNKANPFFGPEAVLITDGGGDSLSSEEEFKHYSDLDESVDFFVYDSYSLSYVDANSIKFMIESIQAEDEDLGSVLISIYVEVFGWQEDEEDEDEYYNDYEDEDDYDSEDYYDDEDDYEDDEE